jgi:hypothetical protein
MKWSKSTETVLKLAESTVEDKYIVLDNAGTHKKVDETEEGERKG